MGTVISWGTWKIAYCICYNVAMNIAFSENRVPQIQWWITVVPIDYSLWVSIFRHTRYQTKRLVCHSLSYLIYTIFPWVPINRICSSMQIRIWTQIVTCLRWIIWPESRWCPCPANSWFTQSFMDETFWIPHKLRCWNHYVWWLNMVKFKHVSWSNIIVYICLHIFEWLYPNIWMLKRA